MILDKKRAQLRYSKRKNFSLPSPFVDAADGKRF